MRVCGVGTGTSRPGRQSWTDPQVLNLAKQLAPALLRVGGEAGNYLAYSPTCTDLPGRITLCQYACASWLRALPHPLLRCARTLTAPPGALAMARRSTWRDMLDFLRYTGAQLLFQFDPYHARNKNGTYNFRCAVYAYLFRRGARRC